MQGIQLPKCRLLVSLRYQEDLECDLAADVRDMAEASAILQQKGVKLCVQLQPSAAENSLPPPDVLAQLAPVIQRVKCSKLDSARHSTESSGTAYCFSATHISALSNASTSLQELCISDYNVDNLDDMMSDASMASIGTFSCLTRLDLVCYGGPALQSLGKLSQLQKLAIHLSHEGLAHETCCEAVLLSNNTGLKKVHLDGHAWSDATYLALLTLTSLKVLTLSVSAISLPSAHMLGSVVATTGISIWFQNSHNIADGALQGLTSSCANTTSLRLDFMSSAQFQHVCTMEHLSSLTIFRPDAFTGSELVTHPNMSQLHLVSCCDLDTQGLKHIVYIFPNLTSIGMITDSLTRWPKVCVDSFVEVSQLRKLRLVDLTGLGNFTADQAGALERAIQSQQELGLLQSVVKLLLPKMIPHGDTCIQLYMDSSHQQVFSRTKPGERVEVAVERYCRQQRVKAGAKLLLRFFVTATLVFKGMS